MRGSGNTAGLRGIDSVDGAVLGTTDGGAHWQRYATLDPGNDGVTLEYSKIQSPPSVGLRESSPQPCKINVTR